jgi:hypothetical protein
MWCAGRRIRRWSRSITSKDVLRAVSSTGVDLDEFKRRYEAAFANKFIGERRYVAEPLKTAAKTEG